LKFNYLTAKIVRRAGDLKQRIGYRGKAHIYVQPNQHSCSTLQSLQAVISRCFEVWQTYHKILYELEI